MPINITIDHELVEMFKRHFGRLGGFMAGAFVLGFWVTAMVVFLYVVWFLGGEMVGSRLMVTADWFNGLISQFVSGFLFLFIAAALSIVMSAIVWFRVSSIANQLEQLSKEKNVSPPAPAPAPNHC